MCTFRDERTIQVCDVAIGRVREAVKETFGDTVRFTALEGGATLLEADTDLDPKVFGECTRAAITAAR
jgi:hypothetical protein